MSCGILGLVTYFESPNGWWAAIEATGTQADGNVGPATSAGALSLLIADALIAAGFRANVDDDAIVAPGFDVEAYVSGLVEMPPGMR